MMVPPVFPRIFNLIGLWELYFVVIILFWTIRVLLIRSVIIVDQRLIIALFASLPILISLILGRGDIDLLRLKIWLSGCFSYLLIINFLDDKHNALKLFYWLPIFAVGALWFDFLFTASDTINLG